MKKRQLIYGILLLLVICGAGSPSPLIRRTPKEKPSVEIKFVKLKFGKPPLTELYFDVMLRNDRSGPRWFLLPKSLSPEGASLAAKGGVDV